MEIKPGYLLVVRTKTGDQLHLAYHDDAEWGLSRRTSCGCRVHSVRPDGPIKERPGLLCEKCFHTTELRKNVKNATWI